jgi:cytochrome c556
MKITRLLPLALAGLIGMAVSFPILAQSDPIAARQALMKEIGRTAFGLFRGNVDPVEGAEIIADNFLDVETLFPEGSEGGNALSGVWQDREGFLARLTDAQDASAALLATAEAGDMAAFDEQFRGLDQVCNACHDKYRKPLN